jgi:glutaredoxin 3
MNSYGKATEDAAQILSLELPPLKMLVSGKVDLSFAICREGNCMAEKILIFGKDTCPYTMAAREDYAKKGYEVLYVNVKQDAAGMEEMLKYSKGRKDVPVIVDGQKVTIGFGGT